MLDSYGHSTQFCELIGQGQITWVSFRQIGTNQCATYYQGTPTDPHRNSVQMFTCDPVHTDGQNWNLTNRTLTNLGSAPLVILQPQLIMESASETQRSRSTA